VLRSSSAKAHWLPAGLFLWLGLSLATVRADAGSIAGLKFTEVLDKAANDWRLLTKAELQLATIARAGTYNVRVTAERFDQMIEARKLAYILGVSDPSVVQDVTKYLSTLMWAESAQPGAAVDVGYRLVLTGPSGEVFRIYIDILSDEIIFEGARLRANNADWLTHVWMMIHAPQVFGRRSIRKPEVPPARPPAAIPGARTPGAP
jgi:hypothetical protein